MPGFDHSTVERVQQANNITDVVAEYVTLAKKGKEMVGVCPFHEDHRPSMYVSDVKQIFKCFACGAGGDVIKFVQMRENLSFKQAIERLAERAGIQVQWAGSSVSRPKQDGGVDPIALARVNDWAVRFFESVLADPTRGAATRQYLEDRHISPASIKQWRLGLAPSSPRALTEAARQRDIPPSLLSAAGLINRAGQDRFVDRLMFPIIDVSGRVVGMGGRTLSQDSAKYVNSPTTVLFDKSNCLYGLDQARPEIARLQTAVVVEGYTDCIMAHQAGISHVVATLGTSFAVGHARMLRRYAKRVILLFDGDTAGAEAANRALEVCLKQGIDIYVATISGGSDPCDFVVEQGPEAFRDVLEKANDVLKFKWLRLTERFEADQSMAGRKEAIEDYLQTIAAAIHSGRVSPIDRGLILNRLSAVLGLSARQIDDELSRRSHRLQRAPAEAASPRAIPQSLWQDISQKTALEREILEILLGEPSLFSEIKGLVSPTFFEHAVLQDIAVYLFGAFEANPNMEISDILARIESVEMAQHITTLAQEGAAKGNFHARLQGIRARMQRGSGGFGIMN